MPHKPDLALAWRRTKADLQSDRVFVRTPYEMELVEENLDEWLSQLEQKVEDGYRPSSMTIADVPKVMEPSDPDQYCLCKIGPSMQTLLALCSERYMPASSGRKVLLILHISWLNDPTG